MTALRASLLLAVLCLTAFFAGRWVALADRPGVDPVADEPAAHAVPVAGNRHTPIAEARSDPALDHASLATQLAHIGRRPGSRQQADRQLGLLLMWAQTQPRAAADYTRANLLPPWRDEALATVLAAWARREPAAAWDYTQSARPGEFRPVDAILSEIGRDAPAQAWDFATEHAVLNPSQAVAAYVAAMKGGLREGRYRELVPLLDAAILPSDAVASEHGLHDFLAAQWARYNAPEAAEWIRSLDPGSNAYRQAITGLGETWAGVDPAAATEFFLGLEASPERSHVLRNAANEWAIEHPDDAGDWLDTYRDSPRHDAVTAAVATAPHNISANSERSIEWASRIKDAHLRLDSYTRILEQWATRDAEAAQRFLRESPLLPSDVRRELHERLMDVGTLSN